MPTTTPETPTMRFVCADGDGVTVTDHQVTPAGAQQVMTAFMARSFEELDGKRQAHLLSLAIELLDEQNGVTRSSEWGAMLDEIVKISGSDLLANEATTR